MEADSNKPVARNDEGRATLRADVETFGTREVARRVGCSPTALLGYLAELPVRAGTVALAREYIRRRAER